MKSSIASVPVFALILAACSGPAAVDLDAERAALREAATSYHAAARATNTDALAGLYAADGRVLPPGEDSVAGMAGIREFVAAFSSTPGFSVTVDDDDLVVEVAAGGDMGYTLATVGVSVTGPAGTPVSETYRDFHVWKKEGGQWKLAVDIWNSPAAADTAAADRQALTAIRQREEAAFSAGDIAAMNALFTDDALIMPPNEPAVQGSAARNAWLTALYDQVTVESTYLDAELTLAGDFAYETLVFTLAATPLAGGEPTVENGKGLHIYQRQADGSWKIALDVWNTDF